MGKIKYFGELPVNLSETLIEYEENGDSNTYENCFYGLINEDHEIYFGITNDINRRFHEHNNMKSKTTSKSKTDWYLFYLFFANTREYIVEMELNSFLDNNYFIFLKKTFFQRNALYCSLGLDLLEDKLQIINPDAEFLQNQPHQKEHYIKDHVRYMKAKAIYFDRKKNN
tara:strand:- start:4086 stop:4595 length:510 start_codon:yes stop_codon:yes gene_type:complete